MRSIDITEVGSWRRGRFVYENVSLLDIVADLDRYRARKIELASADVGALRVTAAFRADQIDSFIEGLPSVMPVTLERDASGGILIRARKAAATP